VHGGRNLSVDDQGGRVIASALLMTALAANPRALIGTWEAELNPKLVLDLREDGLAAFFQGAFFWVADDKTLRLVDPTRSERLRHGDPEAVVTYQLEGDRLTIPFEKAKGRISEVPSPGPPPASSRLVYPSRIFVLRLPAPGRLDQGHYSSSTLSMKSQARLAVGHPGACFDDAFHGPGRRY